MTKFNAQAVVREDYKEMIQTKNKERIKREISALSKDIRDYEAELKKKIKELDETIQIRMALKMELAKMGAK